MIQLFLDGKIVFPTSNASIKLTSENQIFTKSSSYTYDVDLPLDIPHNREVFGWLQRLDEHKEARTMSARLLVDGAPVLVGTAHITQVSETSVKVQLLGEAASYNYGNKMEETYIDELDMGDWFTTTWPDRSYYLNGEKLYYFPDMEFRGSCHIVFQRAAHNGGQTENYDLNTMDANIFKKLYEPNTYPWVSFPTYNSNLGRLCNYIVFREETDSSIRPVLLRSSDHDIDYGEDFPLNNSKYVNTVQPYVWIMARKIAQATGLELNNTDNALYTNEFFRRIFIVNTDNNIRCNACLPHWTVNEWWKQVEDTFGVVMNVDYTTGKMTLKKRADHYRTGAATVVLDRVVDEYTVDMEDESETDISVNNVGFSDFDNAPEDLLSEFIREHAELSKEYATLPDLTYWLNVLAHNGKEPPKNVIYECEDGRRYIYAEGERGFIEVDMFRPRMANPDSEDVEVELKFVPAKYREQDIPLQLLEAAPDGYLINALTQFNVLEVPGVSDETQGRIGDDDIDVEMIIAGEEDETSTENNKPDVVYIAIDNPWAEKHSKSFKKKDLTWGPYTVKYPRPYLRERSYQQIDGPVVTYDAPYSLSLIPIAGQQNLASNTITDAVSVDARVRYCIRFVADAIPDAGAIFLIHNKRFVCEKIEADITPDGLDHLMTGYFFEMDM